MAVRHVRHVSDLLKQVKDISRPNFFSVTLRSPIHSGRTFDAEIITQLSELLVKKVNYPSVTIGDIIINRMGQKVTLPGGIDYSPVTVTFYDDIGGVVREACIKWQEEYFGDIDTTEMSQFPLTVKLSDYMDYELEIHQLDHNHDEISTTRLTQVYPKSVGEISFDSDSEDTLNTFDVTFAYTKSIYRRS